MRNHSTEAHYLSVESEDLEKAFQDNYVWAHTYFETKIKAVKELDLAGNETVLDVGCGQGFLLKLISESGQGTRSVGVDVNLADLKKARSHNTTGGDCELVLCDAAYLPFKNGAFERIACTAVLEHVSDEQKVMREISKTLKNDGILIIDVPGAFHLQNKLSDLFIRSQGVFPFHREYTIGRMNRIIRESGFELESFSTARFVGSLLLPVVETVVTFSGRKIVWCRKTLAKIVCWAGDRISNLCGNRSHLKLLGGSWFFKVKKHKIQS
jgi:ubiquinone/menaquinone biosynthesis C-methylase UbiE